MREARRISREAVADVEGIHRRSRLLADPEDGRSRRARSEAVLEGDGGDRRVLFHGEGLGVNLAALHIGRDAIESVANGRAGCARGERLRALQAAIAEREVHVGGISIAQTVFRPSGVSRRYCFTAENGICGGD